ncbi:MAG: LysM domain-containing protein [Pseudomonadota bacterium]
MAAGILSNRWLIAERHGVSLNTILLWNRLDLSRPIHPGQALLLYAPSEPDPVAEDSTEQP